jgi:hypothetical protein
MVGPGVPHHLQGLLFSFQQLLVGQMVGLVPPLMAVLVVVRNVPSILRPCWAQLVLVAQLGPEHLELLTMANWGFW